MTIIKLAWKNLTNRPLSMLLTLVLFALGVGLTALLLLLNKQLTDKFEKNLAGVDIVVGAKGSPLQLILANMYHIDAPTGNISLKSAKPFLNPRHPLIKKSVPLSLGDSYKSHRIVGTLHDFLGLYNTEIAEGTLWQAPLEVTIGATVAERTGLKIGTKFNSNHGLDEGAGEHEEAAFKVVGILKPTGTVVDQLILTATQSIWTVHEHAQAELEGEEHHAEHASTTPSPKESMTVSQNDVDDRTALLQADSTHQITSLLLQFKMRNVQTLNFQRNLNENTDMQAATPALEINRLYEMMGVGEQALRALALLIIIVSGLSIFIALFNSLKERQYELALMRVMGAGRGRLFLLIVCEGILLSLIGFCIGIILSHGSMQILAKYMSDAYRYSFSGLMWLKEEWLLLLGAVTIGFLAAIIPAISVYRQDISRTLSK
ncbi:MAG: ABC transporter permease [Saprospiraceae bacterium]|nr:ABC transporter permease [Saprospiraceae bacterium]